MKTVTILVSFVGSCFGNLPYKGSFCAYDCVMGSLSPEGLPWGSWYYNPL